MATPMAKRTTTQNQYRLPMIDLPRVNLWG